MSRLSKFPVVSLAAAIAVALPGTAVAAKLEAPPVPKDAKPVFGPQPVPAQPVEEPTDTIAPPTGGTDWDGLMAKARRDGTVPVIVALKAAVKPEGDLAPAARRAQRERIDDKADSVLASLQGKRHGPVRDFEFVPFVALQASPAALEALRESPEVASVSEDDVIELDAGTPQGTSSNTYLAQWWDLSRTNTYTAWNKGYDGRGQTVAILDTGVQTNHPWLAGKVVSEACFSSIAATTTAGNCPNGRYSQLGAGSARPCTYHTSCSHGTHVAGTAAGIYGVANRANIIAVQVFHRDPASGALLSHESDQLWGLKHVYEQRGRFSIASVNLSLGGGRYNGNCDNRASTSSFYAWAQMLRSAGIATVVSSGNEGYGNGIGSPACNSNVVSVGNTTLDAFGNDAVYWKGCTGEGCGSNSSAYLSLLAPGTSICSSIPTNSSHCGWTGTSMAAPHVAGAFAALKQLRPWTTVSSSLYALQASGAGVYDNRNGVTRARIDVWNAVVYLYNH